MYGIEDSLLCIQSDPPSKNVYKEYILTKITAYHEIQLRQAAVGNKMQFCYSHRSPPSRSFKHHNCTGIVKNVKDYYTYALKSKYQGGSAYCRLCDPMKEMKKI